MSAKAALRKERVLCDFWYARELPDLFEPFEPYVLERFGFWAKILLSNIITRSMLLVWAGRHFAGIAPNWYRGGRLVCILQVPLQARRVVILECIDFAVDSKSVMLRELYLWFARNILSPALKRSVAVIQVLTEWEAEVFAKRYSLSGKTISCVRWPLAGWDDNDLPYKYSRNESAQQYVFSSGRAACDWATLFAAAKLGTWPLKVVCGKKDRDIVDSLNRDGRAEVLCELSRADHDRLLDEASVYALCLKEQKKSSGQVRLAACIAAGTPVVATNVRGLEGYLIDGVTGLSAEVGDAGGLARQIESLLADPEHRKRLAKTARDATAGYGREDYFSAIDRVVRAGLLQAEVG